MRFPLLIAIIFLLVNAFVDLYIYAAIRSYCRRRVWSRLQLVSAIILPLALIGCMIVPFASKGESAFAVCMWAIFSYFSIYFGKYVFLIFDILSRLPLLWRRKRWKWMTPLGAWLGVALCAYLWWGALFDRYRIEVVDVDVPVADLPAPFDGLRIAQISDLHLGTFRSDTSFVSDLVDKINAQKPDVIVFTGDIVNRHSQEAQPFLDVLSRLHAPLGVYSVMGNHDYGEYKRWPSEQARLNDVKSLKAMQKGMGWNMLNNSHSWLRRGSDSIAIIGVENVGDPPFTTYGDLATAYPDIADKNVKILLTHNPAHWTQDLADNPQSNIALTLSGHTHAMQIMLFGLSPAAFRYDTWGGEYPDHQGQLLYVNRGAGEVAFPARIGATPEITVFTLKPKKK